MKYIRKEKIVDAIQFTGDNWMEIEKWSDAKCLLYSRKDFYIEMQSKVGNVLAYKGDYIVKNHAMGDYFPIDKNEFESDYIKY